MDKAVELAIRMSADASDVERAFDGAGSSAKAMADDVESASRTAESASRGFEGVAEAADGVGGASSQAAGGLGDLGGALSMMPGPLGAVGSGMEAIAPAIMGVTGAADLLNLATESNIVLNAKAKAATIASAVATKAAAAASRVAAAGQWLLNAALSANPVGIVVLAVVALVAAVVLAYKKSETFRAIVQGVMAAVRGYIGAVVGVVTTLVEFVRDKAPAAWDRLRGSAVDAANYIKDHVSAAFDILIAPIQKIIDLVQSLLDKIGSIHLPDLPDIPGLSNPFGRSSTLAPATTASATTTPGTVVNVDARTYVTVDGTGVVDETSVARALEPVLARNAQRLGLLVTDPTVVPAW